MPDQFLHGIETVEIDDGIRPIQTVKSSVIGLIGTAPDADAAVFPLNTPVLLSNQPRKAASLDTVGDGNGTLKDAIDGIFDQAGSSVIVVRVEEGVDIDATMTNVIGDATTLTGVHAFKAAETDLKVTPRILIAPGFTSQRPDDAKNPVMAELEGIADAFRAIIIGDGPGTTDAEALTYASDFGNDRVYIVDPGVKVWDAGTSAYVNRPASDRVAGVISRTDNERGFWWSPSNKQVYGIGGPSRPIGFGLSDTNSQANLLNEGKVATIVHKDGYRLWGNRTTSDDSLWAYLSVRRTADMIYESVEAAMLWAMDRPFSVQLLLDITGSVDAYLARLKAQGALLGGKSWVDPELNTATTLQGGHLFIDFDIEPPAPLEHLTFRAHRNGGYYEELVSQVAEAAS